MKIQHFKAHGALYINYQTRDKNDKESKVTSINGKEIDLKTNSICVHGDNVKALEFVKKIKENLEKEQIQICALENFI